MGYPVFYCYLNLINTNFSNVNSEIFDKRLKFEV